MFLEFFHFHPAAMESDNVGVVQSGQYFGLVEHAVDVLVDVLFVFARFDSNNLGSILFIFYFIADSMDTGEPA
jgi:hypothetical protein